MADDVVTADTAKLPPAPVADAKPKADTPTAIPTADQKLPAAPLKPVILQDDPPREVPAAERLRAFEDEMFGKDAVRINGQVERGSGSRFQLMTPGQRRHYEALEALRPAEVRLADATAELTAAETAHEAAISTVEKTSEGI